VADSFGVSGQHGLVISDRKAGVMAFRHDGELTATEVLKFLTRCSDPEHLVQTTETNAPPPPAVPATPYPTYYQPSFRPSYGNFCPT